MVRNKSIAQNHLSGLARQGRGGDTELAHVNPREKSMLKAMGGSGGINPNTGLREYQIPAYTPMSGGFGTGSGALSLGTSASTTAAGGGLMAGIGAAMPFIGLGLQLIGGASAASEARDQARKQSKLLALQIKEQEGALKKLEPKKQAETVVALGEYQTAGESLGLSKSETEKQLGEVVKKSGLVTSAGVTEKKSIAYKQIGAAEKGIYGKLGQKLGGIEEWFEGETARIQGMIKSATLQKKAADRASGKKYLGIF